VIYLFADHLGSTSVTYQVSDEHVERQWYKPWGEVRQVTGVMPTDYQYTGQRDPGWGLYYFKARWFDSYLNQWNQPDSIILDPYTPADWNRYQYVRANPLKMTDPDGHRPCELECPDDTIDRIQAQFGSAWYGEWDVAKQQENSELAEGILEGIKTVAGIFIDPIDWVNTVSDCLNGDCSIPMITFAVMPGLTGSMGKMVGHHTIPRQILKMLPPSVAKAVKGVRGAPNILDIPESLHKIIHGGSGSGGAYNAVWRIAVKNLGSNVTPQAIYDIRDQLVNAFGLWKYKP
jgi:RHS repeat-associated protein